MFFFILLIFNKLNYLPSQYRQINVGAKEEIKCMNEDCWLFIELWYFWYQWVEQRPQEILNVPESVMASVCPSLLPRAKVTIFCSFRPATSLGVSWSSLLPETHK